MLLLLGMGGGMGRFDRGVQWYTQGVAKIPVSFPEDAVCCQWCPFLRADSGGMRYRCMLTDNIIYSIGTRGESCPVVIEEDDNGRICEA
jgi:hypothetical protein